MKKNVSKSWRSSGWRGLSKLSDFVDVHEYDFNEKKSRYKENKLQTIWNSAFIGMP